MTPAETAAALTETFAGYLKTPLAVAAAVIDGDDAAIRVAPADETDSLFEIGSITKTMTATLLASLVLDATLALEDPISRWLDAGPNGDITLEQLATHTSGLPRLAPNAFDWPGFTEADPYAGYDAAHCEAGLRAIDRGENGYSNFGYQALGLILCRAAVLDYETLARARIWEPLGMSNTCIDCRGRARVQGYDAGAPVSHWSLLLPGPGGVASTIADMTRYLRAGIAPPAGSVGQAIEMAIERGLGWAKADDGVVWHNGGTAGSRSMLAFDRDHGRGAVALTNSGALDEIDRAVMLAARGEDPHAARPEPVGNEFDEPALAVAAALLARDWDGVRSMMTTRCAEALTSDRVSAGWDGIVTPRGQVSSTRVVRSRRAGGPVQTDVELTFSDGGDPITVLCYFDDERRVVGLRIT